MNKDGDSAVATSTSTSTSLVYDREYYKKYKDGPDSVETFISEELLKLSLKDRNAIHEEAHGVRCLAPEENQAFLDRALKQLALELDHRLPVARKEAYLQSQQQTLTYVNTRDFRLRFLRAELFDARKAALRLALFLEFALECFGPCALVRPFRLSDFTASELRTVRKGLAQFLPFRDRYGRRVLVLLAGKQMEELSEFIKIKTLLYFAYVASNDDADLQRKGFVGILWFLDSFFELKSAPERNRVNILDIMPLRTSAIHICTPDTPFFRFVRGMWAVSFGRERISRIRIHIGESVELRYALESHGIGTDQMPITWSGSVKVQHTKQWMRILQLLEEGGRDTGTIVECPGLTDVVFRKGTAAKHHPGNALFRSRIQALYEESEAFTMARATRTIVTKIRDETRQAGGRFLVWQQLLGNNQDCWWTELRDADKIYEKIEHLVREFKYSKAKHQVINRGGDKTLRPSSAVAATANDKTSQRYSDSSTDLFLQSGSSDLCTFDCCSPNNSSRGRKRGLDEYSNSNSS